MKFPLPGSVDVMVDREQQSLMDMCVAHGCVSRLHSSLAHAVQPEPEPLHHGPVWWALAGPCMPKGQSLRAALGLGVLGGSRGVPWLPALAGMPSLSGAAFACLRDASTTVEFTLPHSI